MRFAQAGNAILLFGSLFVSALVGEVVLRTVVPLPARRVLPEVRYADHPVRRFTLLPEQAAFTYGAPVHIDGRGFRVNGSSPPPAGAPTVLALGDSFTFGLGVRDVETWPARVEKTLREASGRPVGVVNAGTISYGVFQELDLLRTAGLALQPRVLIHGLYWNDFMSATAPPPGAQTVVDANGYLVWDGLGRPKGALRELASTALSSSALLFSMRQVTAARAGLSSASYGAAYDRFMRGGLTAEEWQTIEEFYRELKRLSAEHDFGLMVAIMPVSGIVDDPASAMHPYPAAARQLLDRLEIPFVDAFPMCRDRRGFSSCFLRNDQDAHPSPLGYRLVGDAVATALLANRQLRDRL